MSNRRSDKNGYSENTNHDPFSQDHPQNNPQNNPGDALVKLESYGFSRNKTAFKTKINRKSRTKPNGKTKQEWDSYIKYSHEDENNSIQLIINDIKMLNCNFDQVELRKHNNNISKKLNVWLSLLSNSKPIIHINVTF